MLKGLGNLANLMKQAQEIQGRMASLQEGLAEIRVEGSAGGGMVTIEANAAQQVLRCHIEEALFQTGDKEMLEELVVAAVDQALDKAKRVAAEKMQAMTADFGVPGLGEALGNLDQGPLGR